MPTLKNAGDVDRWIKNIIAAGRYRYGSTAARVRKIQRCMAIEGDYPKLVGKGGTIFRTPTLMEAASVKRESIDAQEMTDIDARLKDMDKVKIDTQVVFPSLFLTTTARDLRLEAALLRAYNSFLGECSAASKGRIRFAALVPIRASMHR